MRKLFILTLALLISVWAHAQDTDSNPVTVPGLTSEIVTITNASFANGWDGWDHTDQWSTSGGAIRIESGNGSIAAGEMVKQTVNGKGAGTYVLTVKYKFDRNSWRGATANMGHACLFITNDIDVNFADLDRDGPGVSVYHDPTTNVWTDGIVVYSTNNPSEKLVIGFGDQTGTGKGQIYCDDFVLTYYPTMDQEAVKASLGMEYKGDLIDGNYVIEKSISLNETSKIVEDKNLFTLTATIEPVDYSSTEKGVIWSSSNQDVATVDENGVVTPAGAGTCDIIATSKADPLISEKCELTVEIPEVQVTKISLSIEGENSEQKLEETKTLQLLSTVEPDDATNKRVTWSSSDNAIATVDENGLVTGVKAGTVIITASSEMVNTIKGTIELTVYKNSVTAITLSQETAEIEQGKTIQLTATVEPENATYPEIKWSSSDDNIASVDEATGLVTGNSAGTVDIIATADGVSSTCKVIVKHIDVEDVTLNSASEKIVVGAEFVLTATVTPSNATDPSVTWTSSNVNVASVSNGVVTGTGIGTATITATAGDKTATCTFEVVAAVELQSESLSSITNPRFENGTWNDGWTSGSGWSLKAESNTQVYGGKKYARLYSGTLSPGADGNFITQTLTLEKAGVYSLTAYARASRNHNGGLTDEQFGLLFINEGENIPTEYDGINCYKVRTSGWEWVEKSVVITTTEPDTKVTFGYGLPKDCPAISQGNLECSDFILKYYPTTLDANAVNACVNKLVYTPVKSIDITKTLTLKPGDIETLTASITPQDATNQNLVWSSSDAEVATVDETGNVKAIASGKATITVSSVADALITATSTIIVEDGLIVVESLTLDKNEATVPAGKTVQLVANVTPAEAIVIWSSSDETIATVDQEGNVTAVAAGEAVITATAGDKTATCTITVTVPVDGIALNFSKLTVETGDKFTVGYTISPENATDQTVTWTSANEEVASVDENGNVTALAAGEAVITAKASEKTASCTITVVSPEETDGARVRMTYVNMDEPNKPYGLITKGESAQSGFNKISGDNVGWGNTGYGVDYITYLQVDASAIKDNYITSATLSFEASGSTDSKRTTGWGVGYNSSAWSSAMTYNSADKSITKLDSEKWTTTKSATTFETFSFDITEAINKADGRIATILVYELAAAGGYIKNPVVEIVSTNELVYKVTFTETGEAEGVKVTVNDQDATNGISLPNGTYTFTATASHCKDYEGNFTVADKDLNVEFAITPREIWSYTVNAVDANGDFLKELSKGEGYEEENVTYYFPGYYLQGNTLLSKKHYTTNPYYGETAQLDSNGKVFEVKYDGTPVSDVVFYKEAEDMDEFTSRDTNNAPIRCSNGLGGTVDGEVLLTTLPAGQYKIHGQVWGTKGLTAGVKIKAASEEEEDQDLWSLESTGSLASSDSDEFTLAEETDLYVYTTSGNENRMLDYIYITGKVIIPATGVTLDVTEKTMTLGEELALTATVTPTNTTDEIIWSSTDSKVATVDAEGNVTAVYVGNATITAKAGEFSATCAVKVYPQLGDADWSGDIVVNDAIHIANYVVGKNTVKDEMKEFYMAGADVNGDKNISISDASATVELALKNNSEPAAKAMAVAALNAPADNLVIGALNASANGGSTVAVTLDNSMAYVALQADIYVPEGVNFEVKPGSRIADSHSFQYYRFDDSHVRVAIYTFSGNAFADNNEPMFEIVADSSLADPADISLVKILASDSDANGYVLGSRVAGTTGVAALGFDSDAPVKVFDLNGIYVSDSMEGLQQGFYIVRQGNEAKKVRIR